MGSHQPFHQPFAYTKLFLQHNTYRHLFVTPIDTYSGYSGSCSGFAGYLSGYAGYFSPISPINDPISPKIDPKQSETVRQVLENLHTKNKSSRGVKNPTKWDQINIKKYQCQKVLIPSPFTSVFVRGRGLEVG